MGQAMRSLANNRSIVIQKAGKGSCAFTWDREEYTAEAEKRLGDRYAYRDIDFKEKKLQE